jgi:hypothetical protein
VSGLAITQPVAVAGRATAPTPAFAPRSQTA